MPDWFWKLTWSDWCAAIQGAALILAVLVACYQLWALRTDQKAWKTLEACEKYETAWTIVSASRKLRAAITSGAIDSESMKYRVDAMIMLNYLEGIAIAVAQGFYLKDIVRIQLEPIIDFYIKELLKNNARALSMGMRPDDFDQLQGLLDLWKKQPPPRVI